MKFLSYSKEYEDKLLEVFKSNIPQYFDPKELQDLVLFLQNCPSSYFVAFEKEQLLGGFGYSIDQSSKTANIDWIFFEASHLGKGVGHTAVQFCFQKIKSVLKKGKVVAMTSQKAASFFEKQGFTAVLQRKDHWGKGLDLVQMEKTI